MSRLAKQPIKIPENVNVRMEDGRVFVKGPLGELSRAVRDEIEFKVEGKEVTLLLRRRDLLSRALWGTYAAHLRNMIKGVTAPYVKRLILEGIGYKSEVAGKTLVLSIGFSHPVKVPIPEGITVKADKNNITVSGIDKDMVGGFAAAVRMLKKPEPYKGKGFRYEGEVVRRKQGKKTV